VFYTYNLELDGLAIQLNGANFLAKKNNVSGNQNGCDV
jgi:hypothetical protein